LEERRALRLKNNFEHEHKNIVSAYLLHFSFFSVFSLLVVLIALIHPSLFLHVVAVDLTDCFPDCAHLGVGKESNQSIAHPISPSLCLFSPSHSLHLCTPLFLSSFLPSLPTSTEQHTHSSHALPSFICQSSPIPHFTSTFLPPSLPPSLPCLDIDQFGVVLNEVPLGQHISFVLRRPQHFSRQHVLPVVRHGVSGQGLLQKGREGGSEGGSEGGRCECMGPLLLARSPRRR